jgi:hypothetical protein
VRHRISSLENHPMVFGKVKVGTEHGSDGQAVCPPAKYSGNKATCTFRKEAISILWNIHKRQPPISLQADMTK